MSDREVPGVGGRKVIPSWAAVEAAVNDGNVRQRAKDLSAVLRIIDGIAEDLTAPVSVHADLRRLLSEAADVLDALRNATERLRVYARIGAVEQNLAGLRAEFAILSEDQ